MNTEIHKIKNDLAEVEIYGSAMKSLKIFKDSREYNVLGFDEQKHAFSFIMAPWVNRIKDGKFSCAKGDFDLSSSNPFGIPHPIHGTVLTANWKVIHKSSHSISISTDLRSPWPYSGSVLSKVSLNDNSIKQELIIKNEDEHIMPFSMGWHPWFNRKIGSAELSLIFNGNYLWKANGQIPNSEKIRPPLLDQAVRGFSPKPGTLDDCYRITDNSSVSLCWPELTLEMNSSRECGHLVVYTPPEPLADLICVEPQTSTVNCFQLHEKSVSDTGILFVEPDHDYSIFTEWVWI